MTQFLDFITKHRLKLFFLMRYLFAGGLAFLINLIVLFVLIQYVHLWYLLASTIAFIISFLASFTVQKFITFRDNSTDRVRHQLTLYLIIALLNMAANGGFMFSFVEFAHVHYLLAQVFSSGIIAVWSLAVYQYIIFKPSAVQK